MRTRTCAQLNLYKLSHKSMRVHTGLPSHVHRATCVHTGPLLTHPGFPSSPSQAAKVWDRCPRQLLMDGIHSIG